jgi:hypothetical protein
LTAWKLAVPPSESGKIFSLLSFLPFKSILNFLEVKIPILLINSFLPISLLYGPTRSFVLHTNFKIQNTLKMQSKLTIFLTLLASAFASPVMLVSPKAPFTLRILSDFKIG